MSLTNRIGRLATPLTGRSQDEEGRTATPLELFFDLVFVVAVAQVSNELHLGLAAGDIGRSVFQYVFVFGAIWWAWMAFTWFASAYDTDDVAYRLTVFVQLTGALVLAAGVPRAFEHDDWGIVLTGYVIMRLAAVTQWLRVARDDQAHRPAALRYAFAITVVQVAWIVLFLISEAPQLYIGFSILFVIELLIPVWAEHAAPTPWHREHIAERYGLFTIIVLGETILAASLAVTFITIDGLTVELVAVLLGGLVTVFAMWWLYFYRPVHELLTSFRTAFQWGYGHLPMWGAAAAVGAGLALAIEHASGHGTLDAVASGYAVAIPVALYLVCLWLLHGQPRQDGWAESVLSALTIAAVLVVPLTGWGVLLIGVALAILLGYKLARRYEPRHEGVPV
jgi:low temperature requirement protein LtrA